MENYYSGYFKEENHRTFFNYYAMNPLSSDQYAADNRALLCLASLFSCIILYPVVLGLFTLGEGTYRSLTAERVQKDFDSDTSIKITNITRTDPNSPLAQKEKPQHLLSNVFGSTKPVIAGSNDPEVLKTEINDIIEKAEKYIETQQLTDAQHLSLLTDFRSLKPTEDELQNKTPQEILQLLKERKTQLANMKRTIGPFLEGKDPCKKIVGIPNYGGLDCWLNASLQTFAHLPLEYLLYRPFPPPILRSIPPMEEIGAVPIPPVLEPVPTHEEAEKLSKKEREIFLEDRWKPENRYKTLKPPKEPYEIIKEIKNKNTNLKANYEHALEKYNQSVNYAKGLHENQTQNAQQELEYAQSMHQENCEKQRFLRSVILKLIDGNTPTLTDLKPLGSNSGGGGFNYFYEAISSFAPDHFKISAIPLGNNVTIDQVQNNRILLLNEGKGNFAHDTALIKQNDSWIQLNDSRTPKFAANDQELINKLSQSRQYSGWCVTRNWVN